MNKNEEFRRRLLSVSKEFETNPVRHLSADDLFDYHRGPMEATEREKAQSHLAQCDVCLAASKDVMDLFRSLREDAEPLREVDISREWQAFQRRVRVAEHAAAGASGLRIAGLSLGRRAPWALAAGLILVMALTAWALRLRRAEQQVARSWQTERSAWAQQRKELELENHRLREQASAIEKKYEAQLAERRQPQLNVPIYEILSKEFIRRSGDADEVNRINVRQTTRTFTCILNGGGLPENLKYPNYGIKILDQKGQLVWQSEGLQRNENGNFVLALDRSSLSAGKYRLQLYGQAGRDARRLAEYIIALTLAP